MNRAYPLFVVFLFSTLVFSACSSLSQRDCATLDWEYQGLHDGTQGKTSSRFTDYAKTCSKYGIEPNENLYFAGREAGLKEYCKPEMGYQVGLKGERYHGVCSAELETAFLREYERGYAVYRLQVELDSAQSRISQLESEIEALKKRKAGPVRALLFRRLICEGFAE